VHDKLNAGNLNMVQPPNESDADKLRRRNRELSILNTIAEALNRSFDLDEALQAALAQVAELLDLHTGWVWLLREGTGDSYLAAAKDLPPALANNPIRMEGSCYCLDTYRSDDLDGAANVNVVTCSRLKSLVDGTDGLRYHASIPLYAGGEKLGVLNVASPDWRELSPGDLRLLHTVGDMLSIAVERARLFGKSTRLGALEERNRLAREIHDTLAQGLTAVALQLESADVMLETNSESERIRERVQHALSLTRAKLEEARRSVLDLRAAPLEGKTLEGALAILAKQQAAEGRFQVHFEAVGGNRPLLVRTEVGLYRIAQEALTNIVQHARARHVFLKLSVTTEGLMMVIEDDGQGFDTAEVAKDRYGLIGMNERVSLLGGQLQIESGPGAGTRLVVMVPH
jgi:two-component system NarL family sensor kinase